MADETTPEVYQHHAWIRQISPMIRRRLRVRSDGTLANLHDAIRIAFGWSDVHLQRFRIHGRDCGVNRVGGPGFAHDTRSIRLDHVQSRPNEWFLYEYDLGDGWQHLVRVERRLTLEPRRAYPVCVGGQRAGPPEDCGGPRAFQERRDAVPRPVGFDLERCSPPAPGPHPGPERRPAGGVPALVSRHEGRSRASRGGSRVTPGLSWSRRPRSPPR